MDYDFTTVPRREGLGSEKWESMLEDQPGLDPDVVPLSVADMEFVEAPEIRDALVRYAQEAVLGYTVPTDGYFEAVLGWQARRHGWTPDRDWVVTSPGVVPALFAAVHALTSPGDGIIIQPPVYYPFRLAIEENDRAVVENLLRLDDGIRYEFDLDDLAAKAALPSTRMLILCSPHNPVGRVWGADELRAVCDICLENDVFIVCDEIHDDLIMPGHAHTTLMNVLDASERNRCMVATAPSKTFNLAGLQCSNTFVPDPEVRKALVSDFERSASIELNTFAYPGAIAAYTSCEAWLDQLIGVIEANHALCERFFSRRLPQSHAFELEGTYLQWVDLRCLGMDQAALERFMRNEARLYLDEGYVFGSQGAGFERINLAAPSSVIQASLERLAVALDGAGL
ncbi:MAG: pyridoxal phosphate-dependent aminotransferase [Atopobiaceae bacterium]|nr:pyridoxal phosphate-dependent aminotransferase [Atopobiaceae bacterium]